MIIKKKSENIIHSHSPTDQAQPTAAVAQWKIPFLSASITTAIEEEEELEVGEDKKKRIAEHAVDL